MQTTSTKPTGVHGLLASIADTAAAILWALFCGIIAGAILGGIWAVMDVIRYYGTGFVPPPFVSETKLKYTADSLLGQVETLILWHNTTFQQAARFGSGVGFITGMFYSWGRVKQMSFPARLVTGIISGGLISGRIIMMITSDPRWFLGCTIIGALIGGRYLVMEGSDRRLPPLPMIALGNQDE